MQLSRNLGLELVRATEAAAISAGRWMGLGHAQKADQTASSALLAVLDRVECAGTILFGEDCRPGHEATTSAGQQTGSGHGPMLDIVADPIDGRNLLAQGNPGAISAIAVAPRGRFWCPPPVRFMEKIVVGADVASALVPQCLDAPAGWTLALVARAKGKELADLVVCVLDRPRHADLIREIRDAGARAMLISDGDLVGALLAAMPDGGVDVLMGAGGVLEGVVSAAAIKALGGAMMARLVARTDQERAAIQQQSAPEAVLTCDDIVHGDEVFFAATGIVDGPLLSGIRYVGERAKSNSMILRGETGTRRMIMAEHKLDLANVLNPTVR